MDERAQSIGAIAFLILVLIGLLFIALAIAKGVSDTDPALTGVLLLLAVPQRS